MDAAVGPPQPSPTARELSEQLVGAEDVMRTVLAETIESAHDGNITESGRTACGSPADIRPPIDRFASSVSLADCPVGSVGIWHTHPTQRGLEEPVHSLPDWANVVFGHADASVVVGTRTSEVIVAPLERRNAVAAFQNALGMAVESTRDVSEAVQDGRIPNPTAARERVRQELAPLVRRVQTPFPAIDEAVAELSIPAWKPAPGGRGELAACGCYRHVATAHGGASPPRPRVSGLERRAKACTPLAGRATSGVDIRGIVIGTVVGNVVGGLTDRILFG